MKHKSDIEERQVIIKGRAPGAASQSVSLNGKEWKTARSWSLLCCLLTIPSLKTLWARVLCSLGFMSSTYFLLFIVSCLEEVVEDMLKNRDRTRAWAGRALADVNHLLEEKTRQAPAEGQREFNRRLSLCLFLPNDWQEPARQRPVCFWFFS